MVEANLDRGDPIFLGPETAAMKNGVQLCSRDWLLAFFVGLVTCLIFLPSLQNGFVNWDDRINFLENPHYRGLGWDQLRWMFTTLYHGLYQPLYWVTLGADYVFWGMNPFGYHLTSLIFHAINAALFYFLALRLLTLGYSSSEPRPEVALRIGAAIAAFFFAVHPLRVESVAWVTERRDVLSGFFLLSATLLYLRAVSIGEDRLRRWCWLSLTLIVYLFSLLSKAIGATFPIVLLILDIYPLRRLGWGHGRWFGKEVRSIWFEKIPLLFLAAVTAIIALHAQRQVGATISFEEYGIVSRLVQSLFGLSFYVVKTIVPISLSPLYQIPGNLKFWSFAAVSLCLAISLVTIGLYLLRRRWPAGLACWVCYIVLLAPVLGLTQIGLQLVADRYSYLSCLAWAVLAGAGFVHFCLASAGGQLGRAWLISVGTLTVLILGGLGILTTQQIGIWHDSERLWRHALNVSESGLAHINLASVLQQQGKVQEAIVEYQKALEFRAQSGVAHNNLAGLLYQEGKIPEAIQHYQQALEFMPEYVDANYNLATVFYKEGRLEEAEQYFRSTLKIDPKHVQANYNLANSLARRNRVAEAIKYYQEVIRLEPAYAEAHSNLGSLYMLQGDVDKAVQESATALKINPDLVKTRFNLGLLFVSQKNLPGARKEFEAIIKLQPDSAESRYYLGAVLLAQNEVDKGVEELQTAVKLRPEFSDAHISLARALALQGKRDEAAKHYEEALRILKSQRKAKNP